MNSKINPSIKKMMSFLALVFLLSSPAFTQEFQRQFGDALDNSFTRTIQNGQNYYVLSTNELSTNGLSQASVSYIDQNGNLQWVLSLDIASVWHDAVLTPNGELLVVGNTLPDDQRSKSIMGLINTFGGFNWVRSYDVPGRDGFTRIIRNPVPQLNAFPYYVLGHQAEGGTTSKDIVLLNLNINGLFNWKKYYLTMGDDDFAYDLEALDNGDLLLAGQQVTGGLGVIYKADNSGTIYNGVQHPNAYIYTDVSKSSTGGVYAVGSAYPTAAVQATKFDSDLIPIWDVFLPDFEEVSQIWEDVANSKVYVTGKGFYAGKSRTIIMRLNEANGQATFDWLKYLDNGETAYTDGSIRLISSGRIAYTDGRIPVSGGFGQMNSFMSVSNLELATCFTKSNVTTVRNINILYNGPLGPEVLFYDVPQSANLTSSSLDWLEANACSLPCLADFTFNAIDECGNFQFTNTSTGPQPLTYIWDFGEGPLSNLENPTHQFTRCSTYQVCLTVIGNGCENTICQAVQFSDNIPPIIVSYPPSRIVGTDQGKCFYTIPNIIRVNATDNCSRVSLDCTLTNPDGSVEPYINQTQFPKGTSTITCIAEDDCGNQSTPCTFSITVEDREPPTIECPIGITVLGIFDPNGRCKAVVDNIAPTVSDNCVMTNITYSISGATTASGVGDASGTMFMQGMSTVTYTVTDMAGNTKECSFSVDVRCPSQNDCINDFNDGSLMGWASNFEGPSPGVTITTQMPVPSGAGDTYMQGNDNCGTSFLINDTDFSFDWTTKEGDCFCWDFKIFTDGDVSQIIPVYSGLSLWYSNPSTSDPRNNTIKRANFQTYLATTENSGWVRICAPVNTCPGGTALPSNSYGQWKIIGSTGNDCADWNTLLANVSHLTLGIDYYSGCSEIMGWDNFCFEPCPPPLGEPISCDSLSVIADPAPSAPDEMGCCWLVDIKNSTSSSNLKKVDFRIITPGSVFSTNSTVAPFNLDLSSGSPTTHIGVVHSSGNIPNGNFSDVFRFCLASTTGASTFSTQIEVTWLEDIGNGINLAICRDTFTFDCGIMPPNCWSLIDQKMTCENDSTYTVSIMIKNETAGETFDYLYISNIAPADVFWNPTVIAIPGGLAPTMTSGWLNFTVVVHDYCPDPFNVCFNVTPINSAFDFCCTRAEEACVQLVPCCDACEKSDLILTKPASDKCCYDVGLKNECAGNFFIRAEAHILTPGVTFLSHFDYTSDWSTVYSDNSTLHWGHNGSLFPKGTFNNLFNFCLTNINNTTPIPQEIEVRWISLKNGEEQVACIDTIRTECMPPPDTCFVIKNDSLYCNGDGSYCYDFTVENKSLPPHTATDIILIPVSPIFPTYTPQSFPGPLSSPGSKSFKTTITGNPGDMVKFYVRLFDSTIPPSGENKWCCYQVDTICLTLPPCDSCLCLGFDSMMFYQYIPFSPPQWTVPVYCMSDSSVVLPCIASDDIYEFSGNLLCSDSCESSVNYQIFSGGVLFTLGQAISYPVGNNNHYTHFEINTVAGANVGNHQLVLSGNCGGSNCSCTINFTVPNCDTCHCAPIPFNLQYSVSRGPLLPVSCGDTLTIPPANLPFSFVSAFNCSPANCDPNACVDWVLTGPSGFPTQSMNCVSANPNFSIPLTPATFAIPGLYHLVLTGHCGMDVCECDVYFYSDGNCCTSFDAFCEAVQPLITFSTDNALCKEIVNIGDLRECDRVESVNWGDGSSDVGPYLGNDMLMHTYATSGTYIICALAQEWDLTLDPPQLCFDKLICDTIMIACQGSIEPCDSLNTSISYAQNPGNKCCWNITLNNHYSNNVWQVVINAVNNADLASVTSTLSGAIITPGINSATVSAGGNISIGDYTNAITICLDNITGVPQTFTLDWTFPDPNNPAINITGCTDTYRLDCDANMDCTCGEFSDMSYRPFQGAPNRPARCGDTLLAQCSVPIPWTLGGIYHCTGNACPDSTQMSWMLTKPSGAMQSGNMLAVPNFNLSIPAGTFNEDGTYQLVLKAICGSDTCYCHFTIEVDCPCCSDFDTFCANVENATTISIDSAKCKVTLNVGDLICDDYLAWIKWGDGKQDFGPFTSNSMPMHTYSGSGTYIISYLAIELNANGNICFEKTLSDTITLNCGCACGGFTNLTARGGPFYPHTTVLCGDDDPYVMGCPVLGFSYIFGDFNCVGDSCNAWAQVDFEFVKMPAGTVVGMGSTVANPYFIIGLVPYLNVSGDYELRLTGHCGAQKCTCTIKFKVDCPENCPCDKLKGDVAAGFSVSGSKLTCKRTFKPLSLCPNDMVTWTIDGNPIGNTIGNNTQMFSFSKPGIYTVCMKVVRTDPVMGTTCEDTWCKKVYVKCKTLPSDPSDPYKICEVNGVKNGDFTEGMLPGRLGNTGQIDDWRLFPNRGDGIVLVDSSYGANEDGQIILEGDKNNFAGIWQEVDLQVDNFTNISFEYINYDLDTMPVGTRLEFRLQNEPILGSPSQVLLSENLDKSARTDFGYGRKDRSVQVMLNPDMKYLVVCLQNDSDGTRSIIGLDNIEICTSQDSIVSSTTGIFDIPIRLFPNPTTGDLTIEWKGNELKEGKVQLVNVTGQLLRQLPVPRGASALTTNVADLPDGIYFLKLISAGQQSKVFKFVKSDN